MKKLKTAFISLLCLSCMTISNKGSASNPVLRISDGWVADTIAPALIHYRFAGYDSISQAHQNVDVLEVDLTSPSYDIQLVYEEHGDSLSSVAERNNAAAAINGTYEAEASFIKIGGRLLAQNRLDSTHIRYWKHEGAFLFDDDNKNIDIRFASDSTFLSHPAANILSGAPMLIDNNDPVGLNFTGNVEGMDLNKLDYEDFRRHQGVRHPRTAVALTEHKKLLLITVDGRSTQAAGMSANELTRFLLTYFCPQSALNLDGGGSTTMWIASSEQRVGGVVNHPTDNKKFDHAGQPIGSFYMYKMDGIYQDNQEVPEKLYAKGVRAGDIKYADKDNDGDLTPADKEIVGKPLPDFFGGLTNRFRYGNFDLTIFNTFSVGNDVYATGMGGIDAVGHNNYGMRKDIAANRWTGPGTNNSIPRAMISTHNTQASTYLLHDGSYFKFRMLMDCLPPNRPSIEACFNWMPCSEDVLSHLADTMARESDGLLALESCTPVSVSTEAKMKLRYLFMVFR
jgi:hypothetical protein